MFSADQHNEYADYLTRTLVRPEYRKDLSGRSGLEYGPNAGPAEPSPAQMKAGREAYWACQGADVKGAIARRVSKYADIKGDQAATQLVALGVRDGLIRAHAETGCRSFVAMASTIAFRRCRDVQRDVIDPRKRDGADVDGHEAAKAIARQESASVADEVLDRIELSEQMELARRLAPALAARHREVFALLASGMPEEDVAEQLDLDEHSVQKMRSEIGLELGSIVYVLRGRPFGATAKGRLAALVQRWIDGDTALDDLPTRKRGRVKRLAEFVIGYDR